MKRIVILALVLALLLVASGCTSISTPEGATPISESSRSVGSGTAYDKSPENAPMSAATGGTVSTTDPMLIKNANLRVEVPSIDSAVDRVRAIAAEQNGTLADLERRTDSSDRRTATATVRVAVDRFDAALVALRGIGKVTSETVKAEDVTEEYVDLAAKRASLARQLEQYQRIMTNTTRIEEVLKVQEEIERVQVELDRTDGRLRYLESRTAYSRITLSLAEPAPIAGGALPSIAEVLGAGVQGFVAVVTGLVILAITALPLVLLALVGWFLYRRYRRSKA
jgi:uncharacterized protein YceK